MTDQADLQALSDAATRCPTCKALDAKHNLAIANGLVIEAHHVLRRTRAHEAEWHRESLRAATPVVPAEGLTEAINAVADALNAWDQGEPPRPDTHRHWSKIVAALAASPSPDTDREGEDEAIPVELAAWFNGRAAAIRDVVAHRASPPEYPGMALVPVPDLDRLARYVDLPRSKLPSPDTDAGLDEHTADLRREEIARQNAIDVLQQLVAATFESDERLVDGAVRQNPDWRPFPQRAEVEAAIATLLRSQDTATARIAALEGALEYTAIPTLMVFAQENSGVREAVRRLRAVLSGETRTDGETDHG